MRSSFIALTLTAALGLAACGGDDADSAETSAPTAGQGSSQGDAAERNPADVTFVQGMIPHHEQAVEMAELALDPGASASANVRDLAARIQQAQDPEIEQMETWLGEWGEPKMDISGDMAGHSMDGMMTAADMEGRAGLTGTEFDRRWMTMMIEHHEGAISMAETVKSEGVNPDVKRLADQIISGQRTEIQEMNGLLQG